MVRNRPPLWNMKLKEYKNRVVQTNLWDDIASGLRGNFCGDDIRVKWRKLRESFSKSKVYIPSGSARKNTKPHKFAEQMKFIDDVIGHKK